jgi:hypothetical protein
MTETQECQGERKPKTLIAVTGCHKRRAQIEAQRETWARDVDLAVADVRFFFGGGEARCADEAVLPVGDGYEDLPGKVRAVCRYAVASAYDGLCKLDDDVYLVPARFFAARFEAFDYVGNFRSRNGKYPADYASGFCYYLSRRAMEIVAEAELTEDTFEDRWVGNLLDAVRPRLRMLDEKRFMCSYPGIDAPDKLWGSPIGRTHIALAQYPAHLFAGLHQWHTRCFHS